MRRIALALAVLCATLTGWTPALAQVHQMAVASAGHEHASAHHGRADCSGACRHGQKPVHPMLCSACFAVEVAGIDLSRTTGRPARLVPARALPFETLDPAPGLPPPKTNFPI